MLDWIFVGELVEVRGISQHGKIRVREHGVIWKVSKVVVGDVLGIMPTGSILLESMNGSNYLRWVKPNDEHFDLIRVVDLDNI
jgi:hypothetical protein